MTTSYLLPYGYKKFGWILFICGLLFGGYLWFNDYESEILTTKVFSIFHEAIFDSNDGFFKVIENSIADEIAALAIIIGGLLIGFSKERIEDEFIYKLRKDSLAWSIIFNYSLLLFTIVFIYDLSFFHVLVFNMFTPLIFFICRFNFLKRKYHGSDE